MFGEISHLNGDINYYSEHFRQRLLERYDITITHEEYMNLCTHDIDTIYRLSQNKQFGVLKIHGIETWVVKYMNEILNTVLIKDKKRYPMPIPFRELHLTGEEFNEILSDKLKEIEKLSEVSKTMTSKEFFVNKPLGYPEWMYNTAFQVANPKVGRKMNWNKLMEKLHDEICKDKSTIE